MSSGKPLDVDIVDNPYLTLFNNWENDEEHTVFNGIYFHNSLKPRDE